MKAKTYVLVSTLAVAILFSCNRGKSTFEPPDSRPIQSIEIADAETLKEIKNWDGKKKIVALAAAYLNDIRLIDNLILN